MRQVRPVHSIYAMLTALALFAMAFATSSAQTPDDEHWKPEKLTNLKVLPKSTTPDELMKIMTHFRLSLGMGCIGCHKGQQGQPLSTYDFADDSKENKEVARAMIKLTDDINTKYPDAFPREESDKDKPKVTCATCHRRKRHPETEPPPMPPHTEATPQAPAPPRENLRYPGD